MKFTLKKSIYAFILMFSLAAAFTSCREEKSTGEKVEDTVEDVADDVEDNYINCYETKKPQFKLRFFCNFNKN